MKKKLNSFLFSKVTAIILMVVSDLAILLNYSARFSYVFIDKSIFSGFLFSLFIIAILDAAILTAAAVLKMRNSDKCSKKWFRAIQLVSEIFAVIFSALSIVILLTADSESKTVILKQCKEILPLWLTITGLAAALFIVPSMNNKAIKKTVCVVMTVIMIFTVYSALFPVTPFKFTSGPVVFDNGSEYSVVFSTNDKGTAYIEYEYSGETVRKYAADNGRKLSSTIHTITVPYEQLSGNAYKVGATRVIDELGYGGRTGGTIESNEITFNDNLGDDVNVLTVSDWHTYNEKAEKAVSYSGDYNAVILLGDCAPSIMYAEDIEEYLLTFASDLSKGEMPVIFTRGNHETRGREAGNLSYYLGFDKFYYTAKLGNYNFVVLDSGEDKMDDHVEYGGMVDYEQNRKEMVEWLNDLSNESNSKTIALSHDNEICIEEELSQASHEKLEELNVSLLVSGHYHEVEFIDNSPYPILVDGGINANGKGNYVASMLNIRQDKIEVKSVDTNGETVINETVYWN